MSAPAVSVLMSVRNGARHLPQTLDSIAAQSLRDFELIAVDDGSTDETGAILSAMAARDSRVTVLRNAVGTGLPAALNRGLEVVRAPIVARADGDDIYHPDRLARQHAHLAANPHIGVLSCGYNRIDDDGRRRGTRIPLQGPARLRFRMLFMNPLLHSGAMFRLEQVRAVGGYDPAYWTAQDSDLWARLSGITSMDNLPDALVDYRVHDRSIMRTRGEDGQRLSLTVPARMQTAYLGCDAPHAAEAAALFQSFGWLDRRTIRRGIAGLRAIRDVARRVEPDDVARDFAWDVAASLTRQARWHSGDAAGFAASIAATALTWRLHGLRYRTGTDSRKEPAL